LRRASILDAVPMLRVSSRSGAGGIWASAFEVAPRTDADRRLDGRSRFGCRAGRPRPGPREGLSPPLDFVCRVIFFDASRRGPGSANEGDGMSEQVLPERPDVGQLRRLAKELRAAVRAGNPGAVERARTHVDDDPATMSLSAAQLVVAREHGFASWPRLKEELEARSVGLAGLSGLAFARAVAAGTLGAGETVVLAGRVVSAAADASDVDRLRFVVVGAIGAAPGSAHDPREILISCRRDACMRTARGLSVGGRLDGPGLTSGDDRFRVEGEIGADRVKPGQIVLIAGVVAAAAGDGERVRFSLRDTEWGEFLAVCPVDMQLPTAKRKQSRGLMFAKAVTADRLRPGQIVTLDGHVISASTDPEDPERVRLVVVAALGIAPGEAPDQREIVISCPRDMALGTAVPRNIQLPPLARR